MAKRRAFDVNLRRDKTIRRVSRMYGILGMVIIVITLFNMLVQHFVYLRTRDTLQKNLASLTMVTTIQQNFDDVNENVLLLINSLETPDIAQVAEEVVENITADFAEIDSNSMEYKQSNAQAGEDLTKRFTHAEYAIQAYRRKINEVKDGLATLTHEEGIGIYRQELQPLQLTAAEMLQAVNDIGKKEGDIQVYNAKNMRGWAQGGSDHPAGCNSYLPVLHRQKPD